MKNKFAYLIYRNKAVLKTILTLVFVSTLTGCLKIAPVKAWHRGNLAKTEMRWEVDAMNGTISEHIYFAKEASTGGGSAAGGGCGCN